MSALPPKADMDRPGHDVRFVPKADIAHRSKLCAVATHVEARPPDVRFTPKAGVQPNVKA
jgi:hypothetical protein